MWYEVLKRLSDVIIQANIVADVKIGAYRPTFLSPTESGTILLMRGDENNQDSKMHNRVDMTFYVEIWTKSNDKDYSVGYELIQRLEQAFEQALIGYRERLGSLDTTACMLDNGWQIMDVYVDSKRGDVDSNRPLIGSQYTLKAQLFDTTTEEYGIW